MHMRKIRSMRQSTGDGDHKSPTSRKLMPALSPMSALSPQSSSADLSVLTLDVNEYLEQLNMRKGSTNSMALTAHLSADELAEHLEVAEKEIRTHERAGDGIRKGLAVLNNLEKAVQSVLDNDEFAERMIRHQDGLLQRAREERADPDARTRNLEADVIALEKDRSELAGQLQSISDQRNHEHDAFMTMFKTQVRFMQELEATALKKLDKLSDRAENMGRAVKLLASHKQRRRSVLAAKAIAEEKPENKEAALEHKPIKRSMTMRQPTPQKQTLKRAASRKSSRKRRVDVVDPELVNAQRERAAAVKSFERAKAQSKKMQKELEAKTEALYEKEKLIAALRRQQKQQVLALQKKMVSLAKQMHTLEANVGPDDDDDDEAGPVQF